VRPLRIAPSDAQQLGEAIVPMAALLVCVGVVAWWRGGAGSSLACFLCLALFSPFNHHVNLHVLEIVFDAKSGPPNRLPVGGVVAGTELACLECFPERAAFLPAPNRDSDFT